MTTTTTTTYAITRDLDQPFDQVVGRVRQELAAEGFGVLTEIDVQATLKQKLDLDVDPYVILGACNPNLASKGIGSSPISGCCCPATSSSDVTGSRPTSPRWSPPRRSGSPITPTWNPSRTRRRNASRARSSGSD